MLKLVHLVEKNTWNRINPILAMCAIKSAGSGQKTNYQPQLIELVRPTQPNQVTRLSQSIHLVEQSERSTAIEQLNVLNELVRLNMFEPNIEKQTRPNSLIKFAYSEQVKWFNWMNECNWLNSSTPNHSIESTD